MNAAFLIISVISLVMMTIHSPESAFSSMINGVSGAISLSIKLVAIYAVWLSVLEMMNKTGIDKKLSKILKPLIKKDIQKRKRRSVRLDLHQRVGKHARHGRSRNACRNQGDGKNAGRQRKSNSQYGYAVCDKRNEHTTHSRNRDCDACFGKLTKRGRHNSSDAYIERHRNASGNNYMQGYVTQKRRRRGFVVQCRKQCKKQRKRRFINTYLQYKIRVMQIKTKTKCVEVKNKTR